MDAGKEMEVSADLENQFLLPEEDKSGGGSCETWSYSSQARTLALVVLTLGLAFAARLLARGELALFSDFALRFAIFCAVPFGLELRAAPWRRGESLRSWAGAAAARVLFWPFAMALVLGMTSWAAAAMPVAVGVALSMLGWAVVVACMWEVLRSSLKS